MKKVISINDTGTYLSKAVYNARLFDKIKLTATARNVLMCIIQCHSRKNGYTAILQSTIASQAGCSKRAVIDAVKQLRDAKLIETHNSNYYNHLRYILTQFFFDSIQQGAEAGDLQPASLPAGFSYGDLQSVENFEDLSQTNDDFAGGSDDFSPHDKNNINNNIKKSGLNFSPVQNCQNFGHSKPHAKNYEQGAEAGELSPATSLNKNTPAAQGFNSAYHQAPLEERQKKASKRAYKLIKSRENFEKYINDSDFRKKYSRIFWQFSRGDLEKYLMLDSPAKCVEFLEKFNYYKKA